MIERGVHELWCTKSLFYRPNLNRDMSEMSRLNFQASSGELCPLLGRVITQPKYSLIQAEETEKDFFFLKRCLKAINKECMPYSSPLDYPPCLTVSKVKYTNKHTLYYYNKTMKTSIFFDSKMSVESKFCS